MALHGPAFLIYNPQSGKLARKPHLLAESVAILESNTGPVQLVPTRGPRTAGEQARECLALGAGLLLVAGGDGTLNEVLAGVAGSQVPVGVLPAGTANVFAMETRIGGNMRAAARALPSWQPVDVSLGRITTATEPSRPFFLMAGAGLDAAMVRLVKGGFKRRFGKFSYWLAAFAQVGRRLPEFEVVCDGCRSRASFALMARVRNYGGDLEIARHADLLGDDLAVVLFEGPSTFRYLWYFSGVLLDRLGRMEGVTVTHARHVEIRPQGAEVDLQVDGEYAGLAPATVSMAAERVRLLLPAGFAARRQAARQDCTPTAAHSA